jgi:hypothetical protein
VPRIWYGGVVTFVVHRGLVLRWIFGHGRVGAQLYQRYVQVLPWTQLVSSRRSDLIRVHRLVSSCWDCMRGWHLYLQSSHRRIHTFCIFQRVHRGTQIVVDPVWPKVDDVFSVPSSWSIYCRGQQRLVYRSCKHDHILPWSTSLTSTNENRIRWWTGHTASESSWSIQQNPMLDHSWGIYLQQVEPRTPWTGIFEIWYFNDT